MKADWEKVKGMYACCAIGEAEWLTFFHTPEGEKAIGAILGDIYAEVKAQEERNAGVRRIGRRPRPTRVSLAEVYATIFPERYTTDPFPLALEKLLIGKSMRQFAMAVPCNHGTVSRLVSGQIEPDLVMLERVAGAAKVHPSYFSEWRAIFVGRLITEILLARPNLGIKALKALHTGQGLTGRGLSNDRFSVSG